MKRSPGRSKRWMPPPAHAGVRLLRFVAVAFTALFATSLLADSGSQRSDSQSSAIVPANSMLHEYVPPDPKEDVNLSATTLDGDLPAAIDTPSGVATAPDPSRPPDAKDLYGGGTSDDGPDSTYEPDRDTRQPNVESYADPFSPSTSPFKRLRAYDTVDVDYTLKVADRSLHQITPGGEVETTDEPFYADFSVDLVPDQPVRIPSVGPGARIIKMHTNPETPVSVLQDGAENWFIRGTERKRVRVVMELAIERAIFGSPIESFTGEPRVPPQPKAQKALVDKVALRIGVSATDPYGVRVAKLVDYFRGFEPSTDPPHETGDVYLDLALSKKGVCRHRSFAFLVTALNLGIPTRMVVNEAHAWVEVYDGRIWHRVDLGGAASNLDTQPDATKPQYSPPPDPFKWPEDSQQTSGQGLSDKTRKAAGISNTGDNSSSTDNNNGSSAPPADTTTPTPPTNTDLPATHIDLDAVEKSIRRGASVHLKGKVEGREPCRNLRVDVRLRLDDQKRVSIGSLSTDDAGVFDGSVIVPRDFATGDYDLIVTTPGDKECNPGSSD